MVLLKLRVHLVTTHGSWLSLTHDHICVDVLNHERNPEEDSNLTLRGSHVGMHFRPIVSIAVTVSCAALTSATHSGFCSPSFRSSRCISAA